MERLRGVKKYSPAIAKAPTKMLHLVNVWLSVSPRLAAAPDP